MATQPQDDGSSKTQIQPCRYKTGKTLGAGSYSVVKECVHIETGRYYAAKVINKRLMAGREHMVSCVYFDSLKDPDGKSFHGMADIRGREILRCATRLQSSRKSPWATRTS